jgi:hypothetical protein
MDVSYCLFGCFDMGLHASTGRQSLEPLGMVGRIFVRFVVGVILV